MYYRVLILFNRELDIQVRIDLMHKLAALKYIQDMSVDWDSFLHKDEADFAVKMKRKHHITYVRRILNEYTEKELLYKINEIR